MSKEENGSKGEYNPIWGEEKQPSLRRARKSLLRGLQAKAKAEGREVKSWLYQRDCATLSYVARCLTRSDFIVTKRTISELSPWNIKMVKSILKKDIVDIRSGLHELIIRGATAEEIQFAYSFSARFNRLANMDYICPKK